MKVKICGITRLDDALAAVEAGADMLGFNFYPHSLRYISPLDCAHLHADLEGRRVTPLTVGVFVNATAAHVLAVMDDCGLDLAQLSGDEPVQDLLVLGERAFKALRPKHAADLRAALKVYPRRSTPPAWLVDAHRPGKFGGTGDLADWGLARSLARNAPILLAGGLHPGNVRAAVAQVSPWGVDVASGVESLPGCKDRQRMVDFIKSARSLNQEMRTC